MADFLKRHWTAFWIAGPENLYTFIWWAIYAAIFGAVATLMAAIASHSGWFLPRLETVFSYLFIAFTAAAIMAWIGQFAAKRLGWGGGRNNPHLVQESAGGPTFTASVAVQQPATEIVGQPQPQIVYDHLAEVLNGHDGNLYTHLWFHNASDVAAHKLIPHIAWYSDGKTLFSFVGKWRDTQFDLGPKAIRGANKLDFLPRSEPRALDLCIRKPDSADSYALSIESPGTNVFVDHRKIVPGKYEIKVLLSSDNYSVDFRFDITKAVNGTIATNPHIVATFAPKVATKEVYTPDFRDFPRVYCFETDGVFKLLFLPDTEEESQDGDALLVLTLGRKLMMGMDETPIVDSDKSMLRSGVHHRFQFEKGTPRQIQEMLMNFDSPKEPDLVGIARKQIDSGLLQKVALSRGGSYKLTERGKERALELLKDMIERA